MVKEQKIKTLESLAGEVKKFDSLDVFDAEFHIWIERAKRNLSKFFGANSPEVDGLAKIQTPRRLTSPFQVRIGTLDLLLLKNAVSDISMYLLDLAQEINEEPELPSNNAQNSDPDPRIFISHSSKDSEIGKEVIDLLRLVGVGHGKIFFTSSPGYGIPLGEDWKKTLKSEIGSKGLVLSLITKNYFESQICLCELGAAWVLSKKHIPILVPPLTFKDVNEIIATSQGFEITDPVKWSSLKKVLEKDFGLSPLPEDKWEPQRDAILGRIKNILER
ncbi:MAG: toll/interleukin-1 receptor domain-containing protein [Cecembia sp.]